MQKEKKKMNKEKICKIVRLFKIFNSIMLVLYVLCLVYALFLKDYISIERRTTYLDLGIMEYITQTSNFIPTKTIGEFVRRGLDGSMNMDIIISNLVGNLILFMPAAYFAVMLSNIRLKKYFIVMLGIIFSIEIIQIIMRLGSFDVDDIILNMLGTTIAFVILKKINAIISKKIRLMDIYGEC